MNGLYKYLQALVVLVLVTTLLGLSSCDKNSVETNTTDTQAAIGFSNITTKATITDLQAKGFGVWAFVNTMPDDDPFMNNIRVTYDEDLDNWGYEPVKYWIDESVFTFVATYPHSDSFKSGDYSLDSENADVKVNIADTPAKEDVLIATKEIDTSSDGFNATKSVDLEFRHILTSVGLKIWRDGAKHQNDQMRIKQVTLSNIHKSGTYSANTAIWALGNDKLSVQKVIDDADLSDTDNIGAALKDSNGKLQTGGEAGDPFGVMMLIPQTLDPSNMVSLEIQYQLKRNNATEWENAELEALLPSGTWEPNKRYTYNVVLSSVKNITIYYIQTKVDPWGTPQVGGTVIIK